MLIKTNDVKSDNVKKCCGTCSWQELGECVNPHSADYDDVVSDNHKCPHWFPVDKE